MEYLFFFLFSFSLFCYFVFFEKKLIVLLVLESFMIFIIFFFSMFFSSSFFSFNCMMIFSVFMVLDSVFGICILISSSRNSSYFSSSFNFF